jgi:adapter protein MecA 1/2
MKIEKLSETQIRCTLSKDDLDTRQLRLSELVYGSEKAQELFHDMIQQASYEFGFEAQDMPLMVEAIPVSAECLVLIITKVEEPEELDTRFSRFTPDKESVYADDYDYEDELFEDYEDEPFPTASEGNFTASEQNPSDSSEFIPFSEALSNADKQHKISEPVSKEAFAKAKKTNITKIYCFEQLNTLIRTCVQISGLYRGESHLYKNPAASSYYLVLNKSGLTLEDFNKVCNIISEYGTMCHMTYATLHYFAEHYDLIISGNTVQELAKLA